VREERRSRTCHSVREVDTVMMGGIIQGKSSTAARAAAAEPDSDTGGEEARLPLLPLLNDSFFWRRSSSTFMGTLILLRVRADR
jgi:hypothetical protein